MVNTSGINQYDKKECKLGPLSNLSITHVLLDPPDDVLLAAFVGYAKENNGSGLTAEDQLFRLSKDFNLVIGWVPI